MVIRTLKAAKEYSDGVIFRIHEEEIEFIDIKHRNIDRLWKETHAHEVLPNLDGEDYGYFSGCKIAFDLDYKGYKIDDEDFRLFFEEIVNNVIDQYCELEEFDTWTNDRGFCWLKSTADDKISYHVIVQGICIMSDRCGFYKDFYELVLQQWDKSRRYKHIQVKDRIDMNLAGSNKSLRCLGMKKPEGDAVFGMIDQKWRKRDTLVSCVGPDQRYEIKIKDVIRDRMDRDLPPPPPVDEFKDQDLKMFEELVPDFMRCYTGKPEKVNNDRYYFTNAKNGTQCPNCDGYHTSNRGVMWKRGNKFFYRNCGDKCVTRHVEFREETEKDEKKHKKDFKKMKKAHLKYALKRTLPLDNFNCHHEELPKMEIKKDLIVGSALGTGKSKMLFSSLPLNTKIIFLTSGIAQAFDLTMRWNNCRTDLMENYKENCTFGDRFVISAESIWKIKDKKCFEDYIVVIDECEKFLSNWTNTVTFEHKKDSIDTFTRLIGKCKQLICLDAFISNMTLDFVETTRGYNYEVINNSFRRSRVCQEMDTDFEGLMSIALKDIKEGKKVVFVSSVKKKLKEITETKEFKKMIKDKKGCVVTGDDCDLYGGVDDWQKMKWDQYDFFFYSPVISEAVSFEKEHFDNLYVYLGSRSIPAQQMVQMMHRVRKIKGEIFYACHAHATDKWKKMYGVENEKSKEFILSKKEIESSYGIITQNAPKWFKDIFNMTTMKDRIRTNGFIDKAFKKYLKFSGYEIKKYDKDIDEQKFTKLKVEDVKVEDIKDIEEPIKVPKDQDEKMMEKKRSLKKYCTGDISQTTWRTWCKDPDFIKRQHLFDVADTNIASEIKQIGYVECVDDTRKLFASMKKLFENLGLTSFIDQTTIFNRDQIDENKKLINDIGQMMGFKGKDQHRTFSSIITKWIGVSKKRVKQKRIQGKKVDYSWTLNHKDEMYLTDVK